MHDYAEIDATECARRVRSGDVSPAELVDVAISAIEKVNPALNAVVHRMYEEARAAVPADGPFRGVPMVVKDFDGFVKGLPFTASCRFLDGFVPDHDAAAIARLRRAGFVFLAKTNCPELAILGTTESEWRGAARNPWNPDHSTGGSSGGSGALVAARAVPLAHGGDGGGSLRIPASANGLVGLKCSRGRISLAPDSGEGWGGYVQWGVLTRSVRDTAALVDVMSGPEVGDPYAAPPLSRPLVDEAGASPGRLRVAYSTRSLFGRDTDPECKAAVEKTARLLADLGHEVEEAAPELNRDALVHAYLAQVGTGVAGEIADFERWTGKTARPADFEPSTWFLKQVGDIIGGVELLHARETIQAAGRTLGAFHAKYHLWLLPTLAHPPVRIGQLGLKPAEKFGLGVLRALPSAAVIRAVLAQLAANNFERTPNTQLFNQTGQPAISLPLHWSADGLPIGVQLAAAYGDEATLVRVAAQLEAAAPWTGRKPGVVAG